MTANWHKRKSTRTLSIVAAAAVMMLTGCQSGPPPKSQPSAISWYVLESRGDVLVDNGDIFLEKELHSGDQLPGDSHIVMNRSAYLIASRDGLQLTANGDTSLILSGGDSSATLKPLHGALRIRLAAAADDVKRIETPHLTASGTSAVLELRVNDDGTEIKVKSGSVALSTSDGDHHARLVAGVTARLGHETLGHLEIDADNIAMSSSNEGLGGRPRPAGFVPDEQTRRSSPIAKPVLKPTYRIDNPSEMTIQLASKLRSRVLASNQPSANADIGQPEQPSLKAAIMPHQPPSDGNRKARLINQQQQFDKLTEGLLSQLPKATTKTDPTL